MCTDMRGMQTRTFRDARLSCLLSLFRERSAGAGSLLGRSELGPVTGTHLASNLASVLKCRACYAWRRKENKPVRLPLPLGLAQSDVTDSLSSGANTESRRYRREEWFVL